MPRKVARDRRPAARRRGGGPSEPRTVEEIREGLLRGWGRQGEYMVKESRNDEKRYRCPWCEGWIEAGTVHVVAYRDGDPDSRKHYHAGCWRKALKS